MREFMILITELVAIALLQTILEAVLDAEERKRQIKVLNIACVVASYLVLIRYVYTHFWTELWAFVML